MTEQGRGPSTMSNLDELERLLAEHRRCGTPNGYDGCYSHLPIDHCRADGLATPCDIERYFPALLAIARREERLRDLLREFLDALAAVRVASEESVQRAGSASAAFDESEDIMGPALNRLHETESALRAALTPEEGQA